MMVIFFRYDETMVRTEVKSNFKCNGTTAPVKHVQYVRAGMAGLSKYQKPTWQYAGDDHADAMILYFVL